MTPCTDEEGDPLRAVLYLYVDGEGPWSEDAEPAEKVIKECGDSRGHSFSLEPGKYYLEVTAEQFISHIYDDWYLDGVESVEFEVLESTENLDFHFEIDVNDDND